MNRDEQLKLLELLQEQVKRQSEEKIFHKFFKAGTALSIENYPKHFEFFANGATAKQRLMLAANRIGKTETCGLFEVVCHAINWYPEWWPGKRFKKGQDLTILIAGNTKRTVRDILQIKLLGQSLDDSDLGLGLIPKKYLQRITKASGIIDTVDKIYIDRIGGGTSTIILKSYEGGRKTFEGFEADIALLDEEPPLEIYTETLTRLMTGKGILLMTFTPLQGMTQLIKEFYGSKDESRKTTVATWDHAPHLDTEEKEALFNSIPEFQRDARSKGIPQLGSGAVYQTAVEDIKVKGFEIPPHWKRSYGLDVGHTNTACLWFATNPDTGVSYIYDEMLAQKKQPFEYARTIKLRGEWMEGVIDPAGDNATQVDGSKIMQLLIKEGLKLTKADNSVEVGIFKVWEMLSTGKLKVFESCTHFWSEYTTYQRDDKGKIVKNDDHFMDAMRYYIMSGLKLAKSQMEVENAKKYVKQSSRITGGDAWMR